MKKKFIVLAPLLVAVACVISYSLIGTSIAEDGTLIEPFFLIPIAWLFFIIAVISFLILVVSHFLTKK